mmetsp:Transcript_11102/g.13873  ORF Transcript_11102/g.13873 Transcript_11102/m.13873 type:complete len:101 (+) Transcript_11102:266-568(+)
MFKLVGAAPIEYYDTWRGTAEASMWQWRIREYCRTQAIIVFEKCQKCIGRIVEENQHAGCWMRAYPTNSADSTAQVPMNLEKEDLLLKDFLRLYGYDTRK